MNTFGRLAGRGQSASTESLPGKSSRGSTWSSSAMPKKRLRRPASFAQANFRAQGLENQPLPASPLASFHTSRFRDRLFQETKQTLIQRDNWPDEPVTESHAWRLTEAMTRLGVDNLDALVTEASRINCGNMTITATLLSAVVVTLFSTTYMDNSTHGRQAANALFATSLFLSLSTGVASFLGKYLLLRNRTKAFSEVLTKFGLKAMEWLAWSTSRESRAKSVLYRMMRTAVRSALMHSAIFSFFAGLLVLLWEVTTPAVYVMPTIISITFGLIPLKLHYTAATLRPVYLTGWKGIGQFDSVDARGLRVQVWTPFSVGAQRLANYTWTTIILPLQRSIRGVLRVFENGESMQNSDIEAQVECYDLSKTDSGQFKV
ncbi:hypothetical protein M407DRAFT_27614 [Tulasnella calospora MUT 4182]|uniref:Uncharacterized protein n=1 Tax=Tulasnella calospora MUT 4182 TaxID=1051891 RepID=A0A0C3LNG6_9AGAM|nr:hypothetical protein M407DRAFT_27614 [Tulasnella calospora MUT 4182]